MIELDAYKYDEFVLYTFTNDFKRVVSIEVSLIYHKYL